MNFHKGILESRRLHYKHLAKLLVRVVHSSAYLRDDLLAHLISVQSH